MTSAVAPVMHCHRTQHAVGHGFFHTARFYVGDEEVRWIYDCGSTAGRGARNASIERYREELDSAGTREIDLLMISHPHADHTNGLRRLFDGSIVPRIVMMPLLDDAERVLAVVQSVRSGARLAADSFAQAFVDDQIAAVQGLGAKLVILVRSRDEEDEGRAASVDDLPPDAELRDLGRFQFDDIRGVQQSSGLGSGVLVMPDSRELRLVFPRAGGAVWRFVPHVDHGDRRLADAFLTELEGSCPRRDGELRSRWLLRVLRRSLRCVQEAYRVVYRDADYGTVGPNATSLSIYSGPMRSEDVAIDRDRCNSRNFKAGWLATGDAELAVESRYDRLFERYFAHAGSAGIDVGTLAAPHHGSRENWNPRLLRDARPEIVVVSVGQRDGWNLPCDDLLEDCERKGVEVHECTRVSSSTLEEHVVLL